MARWQSLEALLEAVGTVALPFDQPITVASRQSDGCTPLHVAAVWGDVEAVEMLVRAGADVDAVGDMGCTPLHDAVMQGHAAAARALLDAGASTDIVNDFGDTAAELAVRKREPDMVAAFGLSAVVFGVTRPPQQG